MKTFYVLCLLLALATAAGRESVSHRQAGDPAATATKASGQAASVPAGYEALVKKDEARFTMPVPQRTEWSWHRKETKENAREYMLAVKVTNAGSEYSFGFYLWKFRGSTPGRGHFASLLDAGQKTVFARATNGHMLKVPDVTVKVRQDGERLVITVSGRKNVARLFSDRPAQVTFETATPDAPPATQTVAVNYEN